MYHKYCLFFEIKVNEMISKPQQNMIIPDVGLKFIQNMSEMPKNLSLDKINCDNSTTQSRPASVDHSLVDHEFNHDNKSKKIYENIVTKTHEFPIETRIQLSFSVDRLLSDKLQQNKIYTESAQHSICSAPDPRSNKCCDELNSSFSCCSLPNCLLSTPPSSKLSHKADYFHTHDEDVSKPPVASLMDFKSIIRPTPVRVMGSGSEPVSPLTTISSLPAPANLVCFHHTQMQQQKQLTQHLPAAQPNFSLSALMHPLGSLKPLQLAMSPMGLQSFGAAGLNKLNTKMDFDIPSVRSNLTCISTLRHPHLMTGNSNETHMSFSSSTPTSSPANTAIANAKTLNSHGNVSVSGKRKRSWSRAVFSNLQRKGLEIQFQQQKYITKPDRRKLAARLNLTDAQVKVWFQNRRMKWRHTRENLKSGQEKQTAASPACNALKANVENSGAASDLPGYSSDGSSSIEMSDAEQDDDEIDVVE